MKQIQFFAFLALSLIPLVCLSGCAASETDADDVADRAVQGLMGQGTLSNEKPVKDAFGSEYQ